MAAELNTSSPAVASARGYLQSQLPAVFLAGPEPVAPRLVAALEEVLDPIVAILDALPTYLEPDVAPANLVSLLSAWLGVEPDEEWDMTRRRETVARAASVGALRGTRAGLELALRIAHPSLPLQIEDSGSVRWRAGDVGAPVPKPAITVLCDTPLDDPKAQDVGRLLDDHVPVGVGARLRVKSRRRTGGEAA